MRTAVAIQKDIFQAQEMPHNVVMPPIKKRGRTIMSDDEDDVPTTELKKLTIEKSSNETNETSKENVAPKPMSFVFNITF